MQLTAGCATQASHSGWASATCTDEACQNTARCLLIFRRLWLPSQRPDEAIANQDHPIAVEQPPSQQESEQHPVQRQTYGHDDHVP